MKDVLATKSSGSAVEVDTAARLAVVSVEGLPVPAALRCDAGRRYVHPARARRWLVVPADLEQVVDVGGFVDELAEEAGLDHARRFDIKVVTREATARVMGHAETCTARKAATGPRSGLPR